MEKYVFSKEIGRGSFGKVYLIESRQTGIQYVMKQIDISKMDKKQARSASREVEVLSKLKHNHVVRYKESYETDRHLGIVMEYCENGDLHRRIKEKRIRNECFTDGEIFDFFVQICLALEYIHQEKILHRDIKTKNIFLTKGNLVKLGDFGVAKVLENSFELASTCIGSPYYISPEICENKPYNKKSDIWSLGCVLYELSTLKYAFVAKNVKILISKISSGTFNPLPTNINTQIRSLLINLLKPNPKDRPTASEILSKPFLQKFKRKYSSGSGTVGVRKRTSSGESSKNVAKIGNEVKILSSSCTKLNDLNKRSKFANITLPETKYKMSFFNNKFRSTRKYQSLSTDGKCTGSQDKTCMEEPKPENGPGGEESRLTKSSTGGKRFGRLIKVESEYYKMIAESNQSKKEIPVRNDEKDVPEEMEDCRRRWMANTLEKNQLLNMLSEAELIDITAVRQPELLPLDKEKSNLTVDDLLKLEPSEMSEDVLKPMKIESNLPFGVKECENCLNLLKDEIRDLKLKVEANDNSYEIQDLLRLTEISKNILTEGILRRCTGERDTSLLVHKGETSENNDSDSVYFDLELKRMKLEKTVGLSVFLEMYRQMLYILNDNVRNDITEDRVISGADTYVIRKEKHTDHFKEQVERMWMTILETFQSKQEYIPDIWECVVRESLYY